MRRRQHDDGRLYRHGDRARRLLLRDVLWRAQRTGNGIDFPVRVRRAEEEMAAANGSSGKDRLFWLDGAPCRLRRLRWPLDHRTSRRGHLDTERPEEVDRQCYGG